ncbi:MAG: hypothetical protein U1A78_26395 [Polyangia bacterium]
MPTSPVTFAVPLEGTPESPLDLSGFLFDARGKLLARAPVRDGRVVLEVEPERLARARFLVAPTSANLPEAPTPDAMRRAAAYEPPLRIDPQTRTYKLPALLPDLWKKWLLCLCRVPGRVVRPIEIQGKIHELPVCHARVHVCEVDPWPLILARIPDRTLLKIRDELLRARPVIVRPPHPEPDPGPLRARLSVAALAEAETTERLRGEALALTAEEMDELAAADPDKAVSLLRFTAPVPAALPAPLRDALHVESAAAIRTALLRNAEALMPWLCTCPWVWPLLRRDEVATLITDDHGRFEARLFYPCKGDHPDVYVWVEYCIGGVWTAVYKPPVACSTRWNYPCGDELVIRVKDPRVPWCGEAPQLPGATIGVITLGNAISVSQLDTAGLAPGGRPMGGSIEPTVWFGAGLSASGITHYRWSYRRLQDDGTALSDWLACDGFVGRHYGVITPDNHLLFKVFKLGPDEALPGETLFKLQPTSPPAGQWAPQINARSNTASAYLVTGQPNTGRLLPDGLYQLKLELFKAAGAAATQASGLDFRVPPPSKSAPFPPDEELAFVPAPEANLIRDAGGHVTAFTLRVRVDNSPCTAAIYSVTVPGSTQECGFLSYPVPAGAALLRFVASHPRGYADFDFSVMRGACAVGFAAASGKTGSSPVGSYALDSTAAYAHPFPIGSLLGPLPGADCAQPCKRAAFAEHLHVYSRSTDGWGRLYYLDAHAVVAFALAPKD